MVVTEASYPLTFRKNDAKKLGEYLKQRHSVNLIGMKRVGISNFLRFFLSHKNTVPTYISPDQKHLFIPVDLNDLVEREIYPFWNLTLKRILDASEEAKLPSDVTRKINALFTKTIQMQDLFLIIDNVRRALTLISEKGYYPTIFFLRFDRLKDAFNPTFFDNLAGLKDATHERLEYVFTTYRSIDSIFPTSRTTLAGFAQHMYVHPGTVDDMRVIYDAYRKRFDFTLSESLEKSLFSLVGGNVQYLQLALIILNEKRETGVSSERELQQLLLSDERINLQSEELWDSLTKEERKVLLQIVKAHKLQDADKTKAAYLWETGFVIEPAGKLSVFSPLFESYVMHVEREESKKNQTWHLTRKENLLFNLLKSQVGEISEREKIIEVVWPEYREFGVSDWAIDRLVARVRTKLREQDSPYEIITVRTRGYKLTMATE